MKTTTRQWLFQPFEYISETKALWSGIAIIFLSGWLNYLGNFHFDGVIDFHMGSNDRYTFQFYIYEGFIDWLVFGLLLYITGRMLSASSVRIIDVMSMQALARTPFFFVSLISFLAPHDNVQGYILSQIREETPAKSVPAYEWVFSVIAMIIVILCAIWMIVLMYRAYCVACNLKGTNAVVSFIIMLLIAEAIIKVILYSAKDYFLITK